MTQKAKYRRGRRVFEWPCGSEFTVSLLANGRQLRWYGAGNTGVAALTKLRQLVKDLEQGQLLWHDYTWPWPLYSNMLWQDPNSGARLIRQVLTYANKLRREREQETKTRTTRTAAA